MSIINQQSGAVWLENDGTPSVEFDDLTMYALYLKLTPGPGVTDTVWSEAVARLQRRFGADWRSRMDAAAAASPIWGSVLEEVSRATGKLAEQQAISQKLEREARRVIDSVKTNRVDDTWGAAIYLRQGESFQMSGFMAEGRQTVTLLLASFVLDVSVQGSGAIPTRRRGLTPLTISSGKSWVKLIFNTEAPGELGRFMQAAETFMAYARGEQIAVRESEVRAEVRASLQTAMIGRRKIRAV